MKPPPFMGIFTTHDFIIDKNIITNPTAKFALDNINGRINSAL